jgi:maleylacetoacetate isomerase
MKLFHYWRSSCSWRVRWALGIKGIAFESIPINLLTKEHHDPGYLDRNPSGFVPCLEVDGKYYGESLAIIEFLEEMHPQPAILPSAPKDKMIVRQMAYTIACGTQPLQNLAAQQYHSEDAAKRAEYARHWIGSGLAVYEKLLKEHRNGRFSWGDRVTLADLCLVPQVYNALRFGVAMEQFPQCAQIYENCVLLPECDQAAPHNQPGAPESRIG